MNVKVEISDQWVEGELMEELKNVVRSEVAKAFKAHVRFMIEARSKEMNEAAKRMVERTYAEMAK
jgi:hypothetical protein